MSSRHRDRDSDQRGRSYERRREDWRRDERRREDRSFEESSPDNWRHYESSSEDIRRHRSSPDDRRRDDRRRDERRRDDRRRDERRRDDRRRDDRRRDERRRDDRTEYRRWHEGREESRRVDRRREDRSPYDWSPEERSPERMPERMPERRSERTPERRPERISERRPERTPERRTERMMRVPERRHMRMSESTPERMSEMMPVGMRERMSEIMPLRMPLRMPVRVPEELPERIPIEMHEGVPDRMLLTYPMLEIARKRHYPSFLGYHSKKLYQYWDYRSRAPRFEQAEGQRGSEQPGPSRRESEQPGPSRRDAEQPGPSRRDTESKSSWTQGQPPPRFQQQAQGGQERYQSQPQERYHTQGRYQSQPQQYSRAQQPTQSWGDEGEEAEGDFNRRMSGLNVEQREEEEQWGQAPRRTGRGGAWGQSQPQHYQQPSQYQRPQGQHGYQQQAWPRPPQTQVRPQGRTHPTQTMSEARPEQQPASGASGAWAKGPPQDLQRVAHERPVQPVSEASQPMPEKSSPHALEESVTPSAHREEVGSGKKDRGDSRPLPVTQMSDFMDFAPRVFATQKAGRIINVNANFFPLCLQDYNIVIFHYNVVFEPDVPKSLLRRAWNKVAEINYPNRVTVFDGMSNVYTNGSLVSSGTTFRGEVNLYHPDSCKQKEYSFMIKEVRRIPLSGLSNYREKIGRTQTIDSRKKALPLAEVSVIEVILKNWPANNLIQHNRVFFPKAEMHPKTCVLSDRLELRYGYFQSAFLGYKLYLNFDVAHRPFYRSDYVKSLIRDISQGRIHGDCDEANHFVKGCKIEYTLPDDRKIKMSYRANKLVDNAVSQTFEKDGETMTVADYFAEEKKYKLKNPYMPLLWVGPSSKTIYLPLELCKVAEDQLYRGALNSIETRKMVSGATTDARKRKKETLQAFTDAKFHENAYLKEFGITVSKEMESVKARVLEPPKLRTNTMITVKEGSWKSRSFLEPKSFNKWCILNLDKTVDRNCVMNLQRALQSKAKEYNMSIGEPSVAPIDRGGTSSFFELQKLFSNLKGMTIVIVVISDMKGLYSKVKTICETQEGILTQCIRGRTVSADQRKVMTTLDNLLLKINAKLGGTNHSLNRTSALPCLDGYVMVVGADVTHAGPGSKIPSVAAVASCCEVSAFQYGITIRVQNGEIIQDLKEIMRINLLNFNKIRERFPEKIFFFRDGVSEGEMEKVLKTEYRAIREACDGVVCAAKITLLVVQKRHHTRFFPASSADEEGKTFNVPVGTCVDTDIVHPGGLDFYLLSHGSLLGTARPTRYRLLHDDNHLTDDELEQLTFYLCHLYSRCNRSVSYPSPTYNAHLAAFRARAYLEGLNLTDKDDLKQVQSKLKDAISSHYPMFFV